MTPTTEGLAAHQPTEEEKLWALLAHATPLVAMFIGPLIVLVAKGNDSKWVRAHAIESLNFSITLFLGYLIGFVLTFVVVGVCVLLGLAAFALVIHIIAAVKAWQGHPYQYPFALRLIKD